MENDQIPARKKCKLNNKDVGEADKMEKELNLTKSLPSMIVQPQTPNEPMEFLSRSWSVSAEEISMALLTNHNHFLLHNNHNKHLTTPPLIHELAPTSPPHAVDKWAHHAHHRRLGGLGKWFHHHKDSNHGTVNKKDRARAEKAHMHAALSIAGLAAALAAAAATDDSGSVSKMSRAVASASELLASHCIELAEQAGADHDRVASAVRSAVGIESPGDLMTLTAAAATALRAESALRARLPKDAKKNASISPYDRGLGDSNYQDSNSSEPKEPKFPCVGELMLHTRKGGLRWRQVSIYISRTSQVMLKMKSRHVGGAFSKKDKCLLYGVCDQMTTWPFKEKRDNLDSYFGLKTAQGFLEFKCKSKVHKQQWVDGIQNMFQNAGCLEEIENSLQRLHMK